MGGIFALYFVLFTVVFVTIRLYTETLGTPSHRYKKRITDEFLEKYVDDTLEKRLFFEISRMTIESEEYQTIWSRIVEYRTTGGEVLFLQAENPMFLYIWDTVVGGGKVTYNPQGESKYIILELYLNTYNKMRRVNAERFLREHHSPTMFSSYKLQHMRQIDDYYRWKFQRTGIDIKTLQKNVFKS